MIQIFWHMGSSWKAPAFEMINFCAKMFLPLCLPINAGEDHTVNWQSRNAIGGCWTYRSEPKNKRQREDRETLANRQMEATQPLPCIWHVSVQLFSFQRAHRLSHSSVSNHHQYGLLWIVSYWCIHNVPWLSNFTHWQQWVDSFN